MKVIEPARELDVIHSTDVLVIGSGPAGLAAAIAAQTPMTPPPITITSYCAGCGLRSRCAANAASAAAAAPSLRRSIARADGWKSCGQATRSDRW